MPFCTKVEINGEVLDRLPEHDEHRAKRVEDLNALGFRVVALAYKIIPDAPDMPTYSVKDETDMILLGFLAFLDPPKGNRLRSAVEAWTNCMWGQRS